MSHFEIISDLSKEKLVEVPRNVLEMTNLKMLFLEGNFLYGLPEDFFHRLPKLMWLDLRNNMLEEIPRSVAHHQCLENLLLTNNNIKRLPNELGLVPNLKALQISENPLVYPARKIISEGTKSVKTYLKDQYEKSIKELQKEEEEETILKVTEIASNASHDLKSKSSKTGKNIGKTVKKRDKSEETTKKKNSSSVHQLEPSLQVKKLDNPNKKQEEPIKIVHNISKSGSKISLKSYFHEPSCDSSTNDRIPDAKLKEGWLNKLRILLNDQERILQQERNLRALSNWRMQKKADTPKRFFDNQTKIDPPFATYPEYSKMPTRQELAAQLENFLKESDGLLGKRASSVSAPYINIEKLINDLLEQLREMETTYSEMRTPRSEIESAGQQIQKIIDIHKKLLRLKAANDGRL